MNYPLTRYQLVILPKIILITGASMGIGLSLAKAFAKPNHHLILVARSEDKLKKVALSLEGQCAKADYFVTDLASAAGRQALLDWFKTRFQDLHVLINNACV